MQQFSTEHLAALGVLVATAVLSIATARRGPERAVALLSWALALVILAGWIGEQIADVVEGIWSVKYTLPLQLTDVRLGSWPSPPSCARGRCWSS